LTKTNTHNQESEIITISKERYRKIKDVPWISSKTIIPFKSRIKKESLSKSNAWIIHDFKNIDKISCYANAILQSLLHSHVIRKQLLNYDELDLKLRININME